jgi:hypothetical protein
MVKRFGDGLETDFYIRVDGGSEKDYELFPRETASQAARDFFLVFFYGANIQDPQRFHVRHPNGTVQIFDVKAAIEVTEVV